MGDAITLESELRIIEVDHEAIVEKIVGFGAKKIFDGKMDTRLFRISSDSPSSANPRSVRLRYYDGLSYLNRPTGTAITKSVNYTERVVKVKNRSPVEQMGAPSPRRYGEICQAKYEGNVIDTLVAEYAALNIHPYAWDRRHRVSYVTGDGFTRFELDKFMSTMRLGNRELPLMLEVETPDDDLTREAVERLGFGFDEVVIEGFKRVTNYKLGQIFDYYARQDLGSV